MSGKPPDVVTPASPLFGSWPERCEQRAFVNGAAWAIWHWRGYTLWASERDEAEAEAVKRFGEPSHGG